MSLVFGPPITGDLTDEEIWNGIVKERKKACRWGKHGLRGNFCHVHGKYCREINCDGVSAKEVIPMCEFLFATSRARPELKIRGLRLPIDENHEEV